MTTEHKIFSKDLVPGEKAAAFLQVEGLVKSYAPSDASIPPVFEAVNFDIQKGEFVCIVGHSGCGKSTILNILAGLDDATQGYVIMNGKEVVGPSLDRGVVFPPISYRHEISLVFCWTTRHHNSRDFVIHLC